MSIKTIAFAGLGLIGGSLALSFAEKNIRLIAYDKNPETLANAAKTGLFEYLTDDADTLLSLDFDLLYICLPVRTAVGFIEFLGTRGFKGAVTDGGSTKTATVNAAKAAGLNFCGGHPIAGKEVSGFSNAISGLFGGAYHILTPIEGGFDTEILKDLHESIGMRVCVMDAATHDRVFGLISHLPHISAFALVQTVFKTDSNALNYTGGGFRDFTRIAASDPRMWTDIFMENDENMLAMIDEYISFLNVWKEAIKNKDAGAVYDMIERAAGIRRTLK